MFFLNENKKEPLCLSSHVKTLVCTLDYDLVCVCCVSESYSSPATGPASAVCPTFDEDGHIF